MADKIASASDSDAVAHQPEPRLGQSRLALIGIAIAAVLATGAFGTWLLTNITAAAPIPAATGAVAEQSTSTPSATSFPRDDVPNRAFKSPSGNLRCSVGVFSGEPGAICQQVNINYAQPPEACPGGAEGVFVGVRPSGGYWPCVSRWREPEEIIAYDTPVTQSDVTCTINLDTGVRCVNAEGSGFTMEYDAGILTF